MKLGLRMVPSEDFGPHALGFDSRQLQRYRAYNNVAEQALSPPT